MFRNFFAAAAAYVQGSELRRGDFHDGPTSRAREAACVATLAVTLETRKKAPIEPARSSAANKSRKARRPLSSRRAPLNRGDVSVDLLRRAAASPLNRDLRREPILGEDRAGKSMFPRGRKK